MRVRVCLIFSLYVKEDFAGSFNLFKSASVKLN